MEQEQIQIIELVTELSGDEQRQALQLLQDRFLTASNKPCRFVLLGLRGAGKTTLGKRLAEYLRLPFISLVDEIEKLAGMGVSEIFPSPDRQPIDDLKSRR